MNKIGIYICVLFLLGACNLKKNASEDEASSLVAQVYDYKLTKREFAMIFPANISKKDSVTVAKSIVDNWVKKKLLLQKAMLNLPEENEKLATLVARYKEDLYVNAFKNALIRKELDTVVLSSEIATYYQENKESFVLNEPLVKIKFIKLKPRQTNYRRYRGYVYSSNQSNLEKLAEVQHEFQDYFLADSLWVSAKSIQQKVPFLTNNDLNKQTKRTFTQAKIYEGDLYYLRVNDIKHHGEVAPLRYIYKTIKEMVLHQRKLQLIKQVEEVLEDDAKQNKQFEIY